jgi:hypothetical protein
MKMNAKTLLACVVRSNLTSKREIWTYQDRKATA